MASINNPLFITVWDCSLKNGYMDGSPLYWLVSGREFIPLLIESLHDLNVGTMTVIGC